MKRTYFYKKKKSQYINNVKRIDLVKIGEDIKIANKKQMTPKCVHI